MLVRGIRGAITVEWNTESEILSATSELLMAMMEANHIQPTDLCSVFITVTGDLTATFPARAVRQLEGWEFVPLMCALEIPVEQSLQKCIRMMFHVNTSKEQDEMKHIYLREATRLRPDLANLTNI
jgi:chorismate mutase